MGLDGSTPQTGEGLRVETAAIGVRLAAYRAAQHSRSTDRHRRRAARAKILNGGRGDWDDAMPCPLLH